MKTISKIILGLTLLSSSLLAEEVKLAWKGCESKVMYALFGVSMIPEIRYNTNQQAMLMRSISATHNEPLIVDKEMYDTAKQLFYEGINGTISINDAINKEKFFTEHIANTGLLDADLHNQNTIIDGIIAAIFMASCMEVVE